MNDYRQVKRLPGRIAIFDLDGCIFDDEWRLPKIKPVGHPDRFYEYHCALVTDAVLPRGYETLRDHLMAGDGIAFITARPDSVRQQTVDVICSCFNVALPTDQLCLFMRGDNEEGIGSVELKASMLDMLNRQMTMNHEIIAAYDDRPDVIGMYLNRGIRGARILDKFGIREYEPGMTTTLGWDEEKRNQSTDKAARTAADILEEAGATFRERNAVYKDNADNVGKVMAALFPDGVQIKTAADHKMYHLFELMVVKMTRFANSGLTHQDSIRDLSVYGAMVENLIATHNIQFKG